MALPSTIAIDGPAGSGKSSVSFELAQEYGYLLVDTGAFYRAVTLAAMKEKLIGADETTLTSLAKRLDLDITPDLDADGRHYTILLDKKDVTNAVREKSVGDNVSGVASVKGVRAVLDARYREMAARGKVVMAGRDIGTVVLPGADVKLYLDASVEMRARRRYEQEIKAGKNADLNVILADMIRRDTLDRQNTFRAADSIYLNTDNMNLAAVMAEIRNIIHNWTPPN